MTRDYKKEYQRRKKTQGRLLADIDRDLASRFRSYLQKQDRTYASWLTAKIKEELEARG